MSELNDDMDELFRRAAENYPLKTDSADWNKLINALQAADGIVPASTVEVKRKNYRRFLWCTLLLLIPLICYRNKTSLNDMATDNVAKNNQANAIKNDFAKEPQLNTATVSKKNKINKVQDEMNLHTIALVSKKTATENVANDYWAASTDSQKNISLQRNDDKEVSSTVEETNPSGKANNNPQIRNNYLKDTDQPDKKVDSPPLQIGNKNNISVSSGIKNKTNKKEKASRVYAGVFAGVDISTIKFQSVKNTGVNLGALVGYQANKTIAIETGVIWDKKFYYSDGKYFNTNKIYLPPNSEIDNVEGNCSMIELPVNLKYNFKSSGKTTWFSLIGLSSYFIKTENYNYTLNTGGTYSSRNRTYTNSSSNLLSVMNLSLGYSHTFGKRKTSNLRIEPYFKIPLKGMGVGSLPITSSGINIGLTKTIF